MAGVRWHRGLPVPAPLPPREEPRAGTGTLGGGGGDHNWGRVGTLDEEGWGPWTRRDGDPGQGWMGTLVKEGQPNAGIAACMGGRGNPIPIPIWAAGASPDAAGVPPGWLASAARPPSHPLASPRLSPFPSKISALIA